MGLGGFEDPPEKILECAKTKYMSDLDFKTKYTLLVNQTLELMRKLQNRIDLPANAFEEIGKGILEDDEVNCKISSSNDNR